MLGIPEWDFLPVLKVKVKLRFSAPSARIAEIE